MDRDSQLAYLAGFVDGEGCIMLKPQASGKSRLMQYTPQLHISQKDPIVLRWIQAEFGGSLVHYNRNQKNRKPSSHWRWTVRGQAALDLIQILEPLLILKRQQAQEILKIRLRPHNDRTLTNYTTMEERLLIKQRLTQLKKEMA